MKKFAPITLVIVFLACGLHWSLLQGVAWMGMLIENSQDRPLAQAVSDTFDGEHPCGLCKLVERGRESDGGNRHEMLQILKDLKLLPTESDVVAFFCAPPVLPKFDPVWRLDGALGGHASAIDRPPAGAPVA